MCNLQNLNNLTASNFYTLIGGVDTVEPFIRNLIGNIEGRDDVRVHYTDTGGGDLRIEKRTGEGNINAVTIDYQTVNQRLLVRHSLSNISFREFIEFGLSRHQGHMVLNQETFIDLDFMRDKRVQAFAFINKAIDRRQRGQ
jgi:hypothetical protein